MPPRRPARRAPGRLRRRRRGQRNARLRNRPAAIVYLPALLLLVPGIVGFPSVTALLASDFASGIEIAFTTLLISASLVTGMLLAAVVVSPRRVL